MATTVDFIEYVCEQIDDVGEVRYKKMFGEYMVYVNNKPILLVCDNTVFVKKLDCIADEMKNAEKDFPYNGAKEHYILDIDNIDFSRRIISILEPLTPLPKPKKKSIKSKNKVDKTNCLSELPNVGKVLEKNLIDVGINTSDELRFVGAKEAFIRIRLIDSGACIQMLYGIQGAIEGIKVSMLSEDTKKDLRMFFKSL